MMLRLELVDSLTRGGNAPMRHTDDHYPPPHAACFGTVRLDVWLTKRAGCTSSSEKIIMPATPT
jgi:hypothetical protein